jgi:hypothetical protein
MPRIFGSLAVGFAAAAILAASAVVAVPGTQAMATRARSIRSRCRRDARSIRSPCHPAFTRPVIAGQILLAGVSVPRPEASARPRRRNVFAGKQFASPLTRRFCAPRGNPLQGLSVRHDLIDGNRPIMN